MGKEKKVKILAGLFSKNLRSPINKVEEMKCKTLINLIFKFLMYLNSIILEYLAHK